MCSVTSPAGKLFSSLQVDVREVQAGDRIDIVNINPVYHRAFSINTVNQMAKVVVSVHNMNGYTSRCGYGGFVFQYYQKYLISYNGKKSDNC